MSLENAQTANDAAKSAKINWLDSKGARLDSN
jgi:hypothetical protein